MARDVDHFFVYLLAICTSAEILPVSASQVASDDRCMPMKIPELIFMCGVRVQFIFIFKLLF
jgi:hypothetical protein